MGAFKQLVQKAKFSDFVLRHLRVRNGRLFRSPAGQWVLECGTAPTAAPTDESAFISRCICGYSTSGGSGILTMRYGAICDHGRWYLFNEGEGDKVDATGADSYVTVRYERGVGATYMTPAPSEILQNDATYSYFPLFHFKAKKLHRVFHLGAIWA